MKTAFTMIELVFVLIVMGVLSAIIIPQTKTNPLQESAVQIASHLRYTQHLSLVNDKYNKDRTDSGTGDTIWYKERWQLVFSKSDNTDQKYAYTIFSDTAGDSTGDANKEEVAINPQNSNQIMTGGYTGAQALDIRHQKFIGMPSLNIGKKYAITDVKLEGGCANNRISFDHLGRPMTGKQSSMNDQYNSGGTQRLIVKDCIIKISNILESIKIRVTPETGYICILKNDIECQ